LRALFRKSPTAIVFTEATLEAIKKAKKVLTAAGKEEFLEKLKRFQADEDEMKIRA